MRFYLLFSFSRCPVRATADYNSNNENRRKFQIDQFDIHISESDSTRDGIFTDHEISLKMYHSL